MDVEAERGVLPDHVAKDLIVEAVVRRVDDPLVLPARPGMRPGRAENETERLDETAELIATLDEGGGSRDERLESARLDLRLGRDQLPGEVLLDNRPGGGLLNVLEPVDEVERRRVEKRELLLDGNREVRAGIEALACLAKELIVGNALFFTHGAGKRSRFAPLTRAALRGRSAERSPHAGEARLAPTTRERPRSSSIRGPREARRRAFVGGLRSTERLEQPTRDSLPAPPFDDGVSRSGANK